MSSASTNARGLPSARGLHMAGGVVALLLLVGASVAGVRPLLAHRAAAQELSAAMTDARNRSDAARAQLGTVRERAASLKRELAENAVSLRPASALNEQLGTVTALAQRVGLRVQQVSPGKATVGTRSTTVPVRVTGSGTYPAVASFLAALHEGEATTAVAGVSIRSEGGAQGPLNTVDGSSPGAAFTLDLVWYALPAKADPAGGAGRAGSAAPAGAEPAGTSERP